MHGLLNRVRAAAPGMVRVTALILAGIPAVLPLSQGKLTSGHDALFYPPRVVAFQQGLSEGRLLPRWTQQFAGGYGEPYFNFNPPLLYYVASFFRVAGAGVINSLNLAVSLLLLLSGLTMYLLASEIFDKAGGLVAGVAYMYAPYTLTDLYVRASYSEFSALPFLPLILWSFHKLAQTSETRYLVAGAGSYALLMLCNNPVSLIFTPCLVLMILLSALRLRDARVLFSGMAVLVLGLALSAFFWLPSLAEKSYVQTEKLLQNALDYRNHFVYFSQLFNSPWGYGLSVPGPSDGMSFQIGPFHIAMVLVSVLILLKRRNRPNADQRMFIAFMLLVVTMAVFFVTESSSFLWARIGVLQYLQFPWRYLLLSAFATSALAAAPAVFTSHRGNVLKWLPCVLIPVIVVSSFSKCKPRGMYDYGDTYFSTESIVARRLEVSTALEYRPKWALLDPPGPPAARLQLTAGSAQFDCAEASQTRYRFRVEAQTPAYFRMNVHYFPGWRLFLDRSWSDADYYDKRYGLMEFSVGPGTHEVVIQFNNTAVRTVAETVSQIGIVALLILLMYARETTSVNSGTLDKRKGRLTMAMTDSKPGQ